MDIYFHHTPIVGQFLFITRLFIATAHLLWVINLNRNEHISPLHTYYGSISGHYMNIFYNYTPILGQFLLIRRSFIATTHLLWVTNLARNGHISPPHLMWVHFWSQYDHFPQLHTYRRWLIWKETGNVFPWHTYCRFISHHKRTI